MELSKEKEKILLDAQKAGWTIERANTSWIDIKKYAHRPKTKRRYAKGWWRLYENGILRNMLLPVELAKGIRSHKEMRIVLGIS